MASPPPPPAKPTPSERSLLASLLRIPGSLDAEIGTGRARRYSDSIRCEIPSKPPFLLLVGWLGRAPRAPPRPVRLGLRCPLGPLCGGFRGGGSRSPVSLPLSVFSMFPLPAGPVHSFLSLFSGLPIFPFPLSPPPSPSVSRGGLGTGGGSRRRGISLVSRVLEFRRRECGLLWSRASVCGECGDVGWTASWGLRVREHLCLTGVILGSVGCWLASAGGSEGGPIA